MPVMLVARSVKQQLRSEFAFAQFAQAAQRLAKAAHEPGRLAAEHACAAVWRAAAVLAGGAAELDATADDLALSSRQPGAKSPARPPQARPLLSEQCHVDMTVPSVSLPVPLMSVPRRPLLGGIGSLPWMTTMPSMDKARQGHPRRSPLLYEAQWLSVVLTTPRAPSQHVAAGSGNCATWHCQPRSAWCSWHVTRSPVAMLRFE